MIDLSAKIVELHHFLAAADLPHAFGGALALAWCTQRARGTIDIDINIFVDRARLPQALAALPEAVMVRPRDRTMLAQDGQARVWWDQTPVDLFLNTTAYHEEVALRVRFEEFVGELIPFLDCMDVAVFKAFFNRTKDWADIEEMHNAGTLDVERVKLILAEYLAIDDARIARLNEVVAQAPTQNR